MEWEKYAFGNLKERSTVSQITTTRSASAMDGGKEEG